MLVTILLVFAFVFFVIAALWNPEPYRYRLIAAGLACWVLSALIASTGVLK